MKIAGLIVLCFLIGCADKQDKCSFSYVHLDKKVYNIKGCLIDSLEEGQWQMYDSTNKLLEWGNYEHGIRIGDWHYSQLLSDSMISWRKFQSDTLAIKTNIPAFLDSIQKGAFFVKFSSTKENHLFNIVIAKHDIQAENLDANSFHLLGEKEIASKGWKYNVQRQQVETSQKKYYLNWYKIDSSEKGAFEILNLYGEVNDKLIEVTSSFSNENSQRARTVFVSILTNLFIESKRFIDPFEKIES